MLRYTLLMILIALAGYISAEPVTREVTVNGVHRTALVYPGKNAGIIPSPVVLFFHGFGADSQIGARVTKLHILWPEATVVYPLGLKVRSTQYKKDVPAWQAKPGQANDRDVRFVDVLLTDLCQAYKVDERRIYAAGSSNGAMFCYVLLVERPVRFAAFACNAGTGGFVRNARVPRPVLLIHGKKDATVPLTAAEDTRDVLRKLNGCGTGTREWIPGYVSYQPCVSAQPIIWRLHNGGHIWPQGAGPAMVRFFKECVLPKRTVTQPVYDAR